MCVCVCVCMADLKIVRSTTRKRSQSARIFNIYTTLTKIIHISSFVEYKNKRKRIKPSTGSSPYNSYASSLDFQIYVNTNCMRTRCRICLVFACVRLKLSYLSAASQPFTSMPHTIIQPHNGRITGVRILFRPHVVLSQIIWGILKYNLNRIKITDQSIAASTIYSQQTHTRTIGAQHPFNAAQGNSTSSIFCVIIISLAYAYKWLISRLHCFTRWMPCERTSGRNIRPNRLRNGMLLNPLTSVDTYRPAGRHNIPAHM